MISAFSGSLNKPRAAMLSPFPSGKFCKSDSPSKGCVAVHKTAVLLPNIVNQFKTLQNKCTHFTGRVWISSKISTALVIGWIWRAPRVPPPNHASKNCTIVVNTMGLSQFSDSSLSCQLCFSGSKLEWCSSTQSSPRISRTAWAFWSMMEV